MPRSKTSNRINKGLKIHQELSERLIHLNLIVSSSPSSVEYVLQGCSWCEWNPIECKVL